MKRETQREIVISALRIKQPIGDIYVGSIPAKTLVEITDFDIRHLISDRGIDSYLGIQRELDLKRVKQISEYVKGSDATFPTSIVLAIPESCVKIETPFSGDDRYVRMTLSNVPEEGEGTGEVLYRSIARVIDGQHRIKGLEGYLGPEFDVNVSLFIDADISDQATIFATVNLHQTKVNRSLVYDLLELNTNRGPEKTCHSIVVALESTKGSPFFQKIKRLGKTTPGRYTETLSQATVVAGILQYICKDELQLIRDRQIGRKNAVFAPADSADSERLVLRPLFIEGRDVDLTNLIWNFFDAVRGKWEAAWETNATGLILNRTNGYNGLMIYFRYAYRYLSSPDKVVSTSQFRNLLDRSTLKSEDFTPANFVPGSSGAASLARQLREETIT